MLYFVYKVVPTFIIYMISDHVRIIDADFNSYRVIIVNVLNSFIVLTIRNIIM